MASPPAGNNQLNQRLHFVGQHRRWTTATLTFLVVVFVLTVDETAVQHYLAASYDPHFHRQAADRSAPAGASVAMGPREAPTRVTIVQVDTRPFVPNSAFSIAVGHNHAMCDRKKGWEHLLFNVSSLCTFFIDGGARRAKNQRCRGGFASPWLRIDVLLHLLRGRPMDPSHLYVYADSDVILGPHARLSDNASLWRNNDVFLAKRIDGWWWLRCQEVQYDPCLNTGYLALRHTPAAVAFLEDWSRTRLQRDRTPWERAAAGDGGATKNTLWQWPWEQDRLSYFLTTWKAVEAALRSSPRRHRDIPRCSWCAHVGFMEMGQTSTLCKSGKSSAGGIENASTREYVRAPVENLVHFLDSGHPFKECVDKGKAVAEGNAAPIPTVPFNKSHLDVYLSAWAPG